MYTSQALNTSVPYLGATQRPDPSLGKAPASMEPFDAGFNTDSTSDPGNPNCSGALNEINMDQFFEAWGSTANEFDIDNSGVVDGADLAIFLSMGGQAQSGLVDEVEGSWGEEGASSGDLNGDGTVNGQDLTIALAGGSGQQDAAADEPPAEETPESNPLQDLLDNWNSDSEDSDLNDDGTVNGQDLALLLGGGNLRSDVAPQGFPFEQFSRNEPQGFPFEQYSKRVMEIMSEMGFDKAPPTNLGTLIDGLNLRPIDAKALTVNILDLYGKA
ncbi:MAG: hypothetical protein VX641_00625 [Planctomycetota bacterium]|nr:hypothetical protein [Planctomycetota bacterium]